MKLLNVYPNKSKYFTSEYRLNNEIEWHLSKDFSNIYRLNDWKPGYDYCHWSKSLTEKTD